MSDQFFLIALAVLAAVSLVMVGLFRRRLRASVADDPRRIVGSLIGGIVFAGLVAFANVIVAGAAFIPSSREGFWEQYLVVPFLYVASLGSLAVLDTYAIWPLGPRRAGAVARGFLSAFLAVVVVGGTFAAIASAADRAAHVAEQAAQAEERQAVKARSAGLSMDITVVDARLGSKTVNGRVVSHLTLDVTLRSKTDIELRQEEPGFGYHWISVAPPGTGFPLQPEVGLGLPSQVPAGSDVTYRLEVPIDELRLEPADEFTTGTWTASLFLEGSGGTSGSRTMYQTESSFMVPDAR